MKTTRLLLWMLCASAIGNAQTISLTSATATSNTNDASTSVRVGVSAGNGASSTGGANAFVGYQAGKVNTTGNDNAFFGKDAGVTNTTGDYNTFLGSGTGNSVTTGGGNVFIGANAGTGSGLNTSNSVLIGNAAGFDSYGNGNTFIGTYAGAETSGSGNVFIGNETGHSTIGSNLLFIDNSENDTPLIWGDFASDLLKLNGKVGIGGVTTFPTASSGVSVTNYKLFVKGGILTDEVRVSTTWADYVFAKGYKLPTLAEVEKHIAEKGHLINVPSAQQVEQDGIEVGHMAKIQQEKIEELTLYIIEQNKINDRQNNEIDELKTMVKAMAAKQQKL